MLGYECVTNLKNEHPICWIFTVNISEHLKSYQKESLTESLSKRISNKALCSTIKNWNENVCMFFSSLKVAFRNLKTYPEYLIHIIKFRRKNSYWIMSFKKRISMR